MRVLITGISGFAGSHLAEYLLGKGLDVYGTMRQGSKTENIDHILDKLKLIECDICDAFSVERAVKTSMPDYIFHLAAKSFAPDSWTAPHDTLNTNIIGELNILEAVRHLKINPHISIAGSSEEYGLVYENELPIRETNPLRPLSPYGVSKVAQDLLGWQYFQTHKLKIVRTRAFNHTGPRRGEVFATSYFSKEIALIEKGLHEPIIYVGNLETRRDFTDVRDIVKGYVLCLEVGILGEVYNICSGKAWCMKDVLDVLLGMTNKKIQVKQDTSRLRLSDIAILQGDNTKFCKQTGWAPEIPLEKTLSDLLNYWREKI